MVKPNQRTDGPVPTFASERIGYLLKHAQRQLAELYAQALAPHGVEVRQWTLLLALGEAGPVTQQDLARRVGVDRTTMVMLIDALQAKDLVGRHAHPTDRRKNLIELTVAGSSTLRRATAAADEAERRFLASLGTAGARQLMDCLRTLISAECNSKRLR